MENRLISKLKKDIAKVPSSFFQKGERGLVRSSQSNDLFTSWGMHLHHHHLLLFWNIYASWWWMEQQHVPVPPPSLSCPSSGSQWSRFQFVHDMISAGTTYYKLIYWRTTTCLFVLRSWDQSEGHYEQRLWLISFICVID